MKRAIVFTAVFSLLLLVVNEVLAWSIFGKKKETSPTTTQQDTAKSTPTPAVASPQKTPEELKREEALKVRKAQAQRKLAELNNTEWQIELTPLYSKGKKETDTVVFKENKVSLVNFSKKGFGPTNFTLTVQEDGMVVWETMQTSEKGQLVFWRGEMDTDLKQMRGVASYQIDQNNKQDYSFISISKKNLPITDK
ncbi:MAG: hypothetical protein N2606_04685 [Candidatus Omnitrophica bacterium]|nr:hypothetical protein [Candidatus Omnitrophota bacterium]